MSAVSRRGLFGLFAGAMATPVLAKLAPPFTPEAFAVAPACNLSLADIVAVTLRNRAAAIADNLTRVNPLFARMSGQEHIVIRHPAFR